ncbi:uncharacterized protein LOC119955771 isoform X2 [Scyliorhinus canicula]|uniref:uncharacterized protein LOC119955771 isoform X2 n=1 Tax=Scyliorhinus canicula TaxID=7830 RepID=UPI0018F65CE9|nr:uncharacterized protein LOC119955771 isoform X2 [Scyliorhinus canicula]
MENSSRLDEVDLAWDNLQEAKSALQQIENKLHFEEDPFLEANIRKHLQSEAFGHGVKGAGNISMQGVSPQQLESPGNCGPGEHSAPGPEWTPSSSRPNDSRKFNSGSASFHSSGRMFWNERPSPLYKDIIAQGVPLYPVGQATGTHHQDPNCSPSLSTIAIRSHALDDMDVMESDWFSLSKQEVCSGLIPSYQCHLEGGYPVGNEGFMAVDHSVKRQILQERKKSPASSISVFPPSPPPSLSAQRLALQPSISPVNKLERLKERIRNQRKLQTGQLLEGTHPDQPHAEQPTPALGQIRDPFRNEPVKHLIRKVTIAPPAPAYKGFNAIELMSDQKHTGGAQEMEGTFAVSTRASRRELMRRRDWGRQEADQRRNSPKSSSRKPEARTQSLSMSPSPKRTANVEASHPSDIFAWREGQRLVRTLLGRPPKRLHFLAKSLDPDDRNDCDSSDQKVNCTMELEQSTSFTKSPRRRLCIAKGGDQCCTSIQTRQLDCDQPGLEAVRVTGIIDGLQSEKNIGVYQNSCKVGSDSPNLDEDIQKGLLSPGRSNYHLSHKGKPGSASPGRTNPPRNYNSRLGPRPGSKRSLSPPKSGASSSGPFLKDPGTDIQEERGAGTEDHLRSPPARSYNADEVRDYMNKQLAERRKKEREEKRSVKQAMEMRKKRLLEVYKKQKEAFSKKIRAKQTGNSPARGKESAKHENRAGAAEAMNDGTPVRGNREPGDLGQSGSGQWELNHSTESLHEYPSGKCSPLRLQDLEPHHQSSSPLSLWRPISQPLPLPLTACEGQMICEATLGIGYRSKQQRIEALCSMATALSSRIENEAKRLGVEAEDRRSPGNQGGNAGWEQVDLGGFTRADAAATVTDSYGLRWRRDVPGSDPAGSPRMLSHLKIPSTGLRKRDAQQEADPPKDKMAGSESELEVEELMDKRLCTSSSPSKSFLWTDSEPLGEHGLDSKPRKPGNTHQDEHKELVNKWADVQRVFGKVDHQATRKGRICELPLETARPGYGPLSGRTRQEVSRTQNANKSSLAQESERLQSHWSPPRANSTSPSEAKLTDKGDESDFLPGRRRRQPIAGNYLDMRNGSSIAGQSHWNNRQSPNPQRQWSDVAEEGYIDVNPEFPRSSGLSSTLSEKPLASSRLSSSTWNSPSNEDPVNQRLAELMKQLQEETEQLSSRCRAHSSLREDSSVELKRSFTINQDTETSNYLRCHTRRRESVETLLDGRESVLGRTYTSLNGGTLVKDILVEQSVWSLLPSESHWRQTMESNMKLQSGENVVQSPTNDPFRKWQEAGTSIFGSSDAFSRFTLEMAQQYLKEEELRARHQAALFRLREKALREKTKAELAWLEHQKTHLRDKGEDDKMPAIVQKQREILMKLQQEKAEIRHLQNVYKAAHQERKLLLRQQQEIFRVHQTTTHLQGQLDRSAVLEMKDTMIDTAAVHQSEHVVSPDLSPRLPDQQEWSCSSLSASGTEDSITVKQLKKMHSRLDERFLTKKEKELIKRRRQAEDLLAWKKRLDAEEMAIHRLESSAASPQSPQEQEEGPSPKVPLRETDNWNDEECSHSPISNKLFGSLKAVTLAAHGPLDEQSQGQQNMEPPAEGLEQMATIVLKPSEQSAAEVAEIRSEQCSLSTEPPLEPATGENRSSPLRREVARRKAMMYNLRSEQKRQRREKLKMEEAELCRQLEEYDAFISKTQAELISDADFNLMRKPQIKSPAVSQYKPPMIFPWLQRYKDDRSNISKHPAKPNAEIFQPQDTPSKQGEETKDMERILKPQLTTGSVDMICPPGESELGDQSSHDPVSQLPPSCVPDDGDQRVENQSGMLTPYGSAESSGSSDIIIESLDSSLLCEEEILRNSDPDYSACNRSQNDGSSDGALTENSTVVLEEEGIGQILLTKPLFGRKLHLNDDWDGFATKSMDNLLQTSAHHLLQNNTNLEAEESIELNNVVKTSVDTKESWVGLPDHSEKVSSFRASSNHQPALELEGNEVLKPKREVDCQETTSAGLPDNSCEPTATPLSSGGSHVLKGNAALTRGQLALASCPRTADLISPVLPLSSIYVTANTEGNSKGQDQVSMGNGAVQSSTRYGLCANQNLPSLLEQTHPFRSGTVEEIALYRADSSPVVEGIVSGSDELPSLKHKQKSCGSQSLSPVLMESLCKEEDLASAKGFGSLAAEEQPSLVEEISSIKEELLSSVDEDSMFNIQELNSPVDEFMFYASEDFALPDEADIVFEAEDFPAPPEEIILLMNEELPSAIAENTLVRIEDLPPLSVDNSSVNRGLPSPGEKHHLVNTDDFAPLPPPVEEMDEETKYSAPEKRSLQACGEEGNSSQFVEENILLPESLSTHIPQTEHQTANDDRIQMLVRHNELCTFKNEGHALFDQSCWAGEELNNPKEDNDGTSCGIKHFKYINEYDIPITPDNIPCPWADYEFDTDITHSEDLFPAGACGRSYKNIHDESNEAHSFEEVSEEKANEKEDTSLLRGKQPALCRLGQGEPQPGGVGGPELERIILECAKAVESFVTSHDFLDSEAQPELQLAARANWEGFDGARASQGTWGKDGSQVVDEVTERLSEYLVEETLDELTRIREQQNQSSKGSREKARDGHRITRDCAKSAQQNISLLRGQRGRDKSFTDARDLFRINCVPVKDQIRTTKSGHHEEFIENVTEHLLTKFIGDAAKECTQIKKKSNRKLNSNGILYPLTAVDYMTPHNEVFHTDAFGSSQDVGIGRLKGLQPFQDRKSPGQRFALDHWCSGPWRQSKETAFAVPFSLVDVQQWVDNAINVLWCQRGQHPGSGETNVLEVQGYANEMDGDAESKGAHKQAIFDLTSDIFQTLLMKEPTPKQYPWLKHKPWVGLASGHVPNTEDKREVKSLIQGRVAKLLNLDRNDLEMKRKIQKLTKYCKSKRDHVDIILIQELQEEEYQWLAYAEDELTVKMKLTEDVFNILIHDTVDVLNTICNRRLAGQTLTVSSIQ